MHVLLLCSCLQSRQQSSQTQKNRRQLRQSWWQSTTVCWGWTLHTYTHEHNHHQQVGAYFPIQMLTHHYESPTEEIVIIMSRTSIALPGYRHSWPSVDTLFLVLVLAVSSVCPPAFDSVEKRGHGNGSIIVWADSLLLVGGTLVDTQHCPSTLHANTPCRKHESKHCTHKHLPTATLLVSSLDQLEWYGFPVRLGPEGQLCSETLLTTCQCLSDERL